MRERIRDEGERMRVEGGWIKKKIVLYYSSFIPHPFPRVDSSFQIFFLTIDY
jgi:hypothetical protein